MRYETYSDLSIQEYIAVLYRAFMGRDYDQGGMDYWLGRLNGGSSRMEVLDAFAACAEFQDILKEFGL